MGLVSAQSAEYTKYAFASASAEYSKTVSLACLVPEDIAIEFQRLQWGLGCMALKRSFVGNNMPLAICSHNTIFSSSINDVRNVCHL